MNYKEIIKNDKGKAMIELAIVTPLLVILILGIVDIFFIIQKNQQLSVLVREVGNVAFRECATVDDTNSSTCLNAAITEASSFIQNSPSIQGAQLSVQSWNVENNTTSQLKGSAGTGTPRIDGSFVAALHSYDYELRDTLITVEVYLPNDSNTPFFNRNLYDAIIF